MSLLPNFSNYLNISKLCAHVELIFDKINLDAYFHIFVSKRKLRGHDQRRQKLRERKIEDTGGKGTECIQSTIKRYL